MKKIIPNKYVLIKAIVALLALGNLVLLFRFDYQLPGIFSNSSSQKQENDSQTNATKDESMWHIQVPSEAIEYDGSNTLDLHNDVFVFDADHQKQTDVDVFISILDGESSTEKIVEYSAHDDKGNRITAHRNLRLSKYSGPSISILGEFPNLSTKSLPNLLSILQAENLIVAKDGWGNDITSAITITTVSEEPKNGIYVYDLSIVNMLNDSYSTKITLVIPVDGPVLKLTTDKVTLKVGDEFDFYDYIEYAQDEMGNDLSSYIRVNGTLDTSQVGLYALEFYFTAPYPEDLPRKTLTVVVQSE